MFPARILLGEAARNCKTNIYDILSCPPARIAYKGAMKEREETRELIQTFRRGDFRQVVAAFDQMPAARQKTFAKRHASVLIGALVFPGRLNEALVRWQQLRDECGEEEVIACRFFLGVGYGRISGYDQARGYFVDNLRRLHRGAPLSHLAAFYVYQGAAFYYLIRCRYRNAHAMAQRAFAMAVRANDIFGKVLAWDLQGHALLETGELARGLSLLEEAAEIAGELGNGGIVKALRVTLVQNRARAGMNPADDLARIDGVLDGELPEDNYSAAVLLLEKARQLTLRGQVTASGRILEEAVAVIIASGHQRHQVRLALGRAWNALLQGRGREGLRAIREAARLIDPEVDRGLEIRMLDLQYRLREAEGQADEETRQRIIRLTRLSGSGKSGRILSRRGYEVGPLSRRGEDPLGDLLDDSSGGRLQGGDRFAPVVESGYLILFHQILAIPPGERCLYFDLLPGSLIIFDRGDVRLLPRGMTRTIRAVFRALSQGSRTREDLIREIWGYEYHPLRHDQTVFSTISRMRSLLAECSAWLVAGEQGYYMDKGIRMRFHSHVQGEAGQEEQPGRPAVRPVEDVVEVVRPAGDVQAPAGENLLETRFRHDINHRQLSILTWLEDHAHINVNHCVEMFETSRITATRDLSALVKLGLLHRLGKGRATTYARA